MTDKASPPLITSDGYQGSSVLGSLSIGALVANANWHS